MSLTPPAVVDAQRRAVLVAAQLQALVRDHWGEDPGRGPESFPGGAALVAGARGWVLLDEDPERRLGRALAWADRRGVSDLNVLAGPGSDLLARRAGAFARPPRMWAVDGRSVTPAVAAPAHVVAPGPVGVESLVDLLETSGVEVVVEHGDLVGEILGLEIARVVVDPEAGARLEVGVGRHDREAFALVHGALPAPEALAAVCAAVRRYRRPEVPAHPLNRLASERWLRRQIIADPARVGARTLVPAEATLRRDSVNTPTPAIALGGDGDGVEVVVACSTGVDLDLVPAAADARLAHAPTARLVLVVPERDAHPVTARLAGALRQPAEVVAVAPDWYR